MGEPSLNSQMDSAMYSRLDTADLYLDFARKTFRQRMIYKTDMLMKVASQFFGLFVQVSVWQVLLAAQSQGNSVTVQDMVTYVILGMLISSLTDSYIDSRIAERVQDGSIATDFIRPVNFKYYMIFEDLGESGLMAFATTLPACVFGALYWGLRLPEKPMTLALFLATLAGGIIVVTHLNYTLGLLSFWFKTSYHVDWLFGAMRTLFSGALVPLWFYPPGLRSVSEVFPWQLASFAPLAVFLEKTSLSEALKVLIFQSAWLAILLGVERMLWQKAQEKIEVYGG